MKIEPIEIKEFINQLVTQIEEGVDIETRNIVGEIDIEVSVEKISQKEGGLKIYVASGKTQGQNSQIGRARFSVRPKESEREKKLSAEVERQNEENNKKWKDW